MMVSTAKTLSPLFPVGAERLRPSLGSSNMRRGERSREGNAFVTCVNARITDEDRSALDDGSWRTIRAKTSSPHDKTAHRGDFALC